MSNATPTPAPSAGGDTLILRLVQAGDRLCDDLNVILADDECAGRAEMLIDADKSLADWELVSAPVGPRA